MRRLLAGDLDRRVQVLHFTRQDAQHWRWHHEADSWAQVERGRGRAVLSPSSRSVPPVTLRMRSHPSRDRQTLLRMDGMDLLVVDLQPIRESPGYAELSCGQVRLVDCRAAPQSRTGRDDLCRPTAVEQPELFFPGVVSEVYRESLEQEISRETEARRVLVVPPEIRLRAGDLVYLSDRPWVVRTVGDLDPDRTEYLMERREDV